MSRASFLNSNVAKRPRDSYPERDMATYLPALIWAISGFICLGIAKHRHVKQTAIRAMLVTLFGPVAIPWVLVARAEEFALASDLACKAS